MCSEEGLNFEETRESWGNYKSMREDATTAALLGFSSVQEMHESEEEHFEYETDDAQETALPIDEIVQLGEAIQEAISEELMQDINQMDDVQVFAGLDNAHGDTLAALEIIKKRSEHYKAKAKTLSKQADEAIEDMIREIRRSQDD